MAHSLTTAEIINRLTSTPMGTAGCIAGALAFGLATPGYAAEFMVSSASEINSALNSAGPGDTLIMTDGNWTNQTIEFEGFGTASNPITLRAQTPGGVILNGSSRLEISGDHLVVDGLRFEGGSLSSGHVVQFRGDNGPATNSRFTNSAIIDYNPSNVDTRYFWVSMYGDNNRVDNNTFSGQDHSGVTVVVWRDNNSADNHRIDHNHFADRPVPVNPSSTNGFETIRIGTSTNSLSDSFTVVENNLFERLDGEIEIISNKSGNNTFRGNTFRESAGTLTLRHGNDNTVESNFFLGADKDRSGAIRVIGERQTIVNNYIANVDNRAGGAISISAGVDGSAVNEYFQVKDALIAHNTIVNTEGPMITFDDGLGSSSRTLLAEDVTVANNLFRSDGPTIFEGIEGSGWTWTSNLAFGGNLGPKAGDSGITVADPLLSADGELWRPSATGPAIDNAASGFGVLDDMDGQARIGIPDIGADEVSSATIVRMPLSEGDVGASWISDPVDPPEPGEGQGVLRTYAFTVQAEDYSSVSDPNLDGDTWTVVSESSASGGEVIQAPDGSRTNIPGDTQDALASYDVTFLTPGSYTAYYRARGFDGSSDSLYTADGFAVDPDVNETTSNDGAFRWEVGDTFNITAGLIDIPLEFRIGRREGDTQLDSIVFHLDGSLSPVELDSLFDYLPGDINEDGMVGLLDLDILGANWNDSLTGRDEGDLNGDGVVSLLDLDILGANWGTGAVSGATLYSALAYGTAIPEPSGLVVFAAGLGVASRRRQNHSLV